MAFAIIIPAVYFPILLMLLALVFRGVALEFRFEHVRLRRLWDRAFCGGSLVATFAQGVVLGSFIQVFKAEGRVFAGSSFDFATPFALLTGVALVFGYGLLGAGWLVMKTDGPLQALVAPGRARLSDRGVLLHCRRQCVDAAGQQRDRAALVRLAEHGPAAAVAGREPGGRALRLACAGKGWGLAGLRRLVALFALSFVGVAVSLWPMIVPRHFTLWQAASPESTQAFLLVGTLVLLPVILFYTGWLYWVFRGKVRQGESYHTA